MIKALRSNERGQAKHGWLQTFHTFSFADYQNPQQMGFSVLRVMNEDRIAAGAGFPTHSHQHMEILTYIVEGALEHKDSLGNSAVIRAGDLQRMSAGTGVRHSEANASKQVGVHLLQIWIFPDQDQYPPSYGQKNFSEKLAKGQFVLIASNFGRDGSVSLNQDVDVYAVKSPPAGERILNTDDSRSYWLQVIKGSVKMNEFTANAGDSLQARLETRLHFQWSTDAEFILFDLP